MYSPVQANVDCQRRGFRLSNKRWQQICEIEAISGVQQESLFQDRQQLLDQKIGARIVDREERVERARAPGSGRPIDSRNTSANTIQAPYWWINSFMTDDQNSADGLLRPLSESQGQAPGEMTTKRSLV